MPKFLRAVICSLYCPIKKIDKNNIIAFFKKITKFDLF